MKQQLTIIEAFEELPTRFECHLYSKWYWGLESASISITTPKGGTRTVYKLKNNKWSQEEGQLIKELANTTGDKVFLTKPQIELFASAASK